MEIPALESKVYNDRYNNAMGQLIIDGVVITSSVVGRARLDQAAATPIALENVPRWDNVDSVPPGQSLIAVQPRSPEGSLPYCYPHDTTDADIKSSKYILEVWKDHACHQVQAIANCGASVERLSHPNVSAGNDMNQYQKSGWVLCGRCHRRGISSASCARRLFLRIVLRFSILRIRESMKLS